jgi:hypothetical protein
MSGDVVIRLRYRVPAAAPEPYNRAEHWGFRSSARLMRAILNAARIFSFSNPVGVVEDGHRKSQRDRVLTGCGRAIRSLTTHDAQPARAFNLFGLVSAARRLFTFGNPRFQFRQEPARRVADQLECPFVVAVVHARTKAWSRPDDVPKISERGA